MKKENMDFGQALRLLAERAGVTIPSKFEREEGKEEKEKLYQVNEAATQYFHNLLLNSPDGEKARSYVARRGFSAKTVADFQLGFSLNSWDSLKQYLSERGYTENELLNAGLILEGDTGRTHDRFRNKLMFPIQDIKGHVIGFGARVLDNSLPKYINSPQTPTFDKSGSLYGINLAAPAIRQQGMTVIVEGYIDVITAYQNGFNNVVASMGTSVTEKQINVLKKLSKTLILALDADIAGIEAMLLAEKTSMEALNEDSTPIYYQNPERPSQALNEVQVRQSQKYSRIVAYAGIPDVSVKVLVLPESKDPDDVIKEGADAWGELVTKAIPIMDYAFNTVTVKLDLTTPKDKSLAVEKLLPIIAEMKDMVSKAHYLQKLARLVKVSERVIEAELSRIKPRPDRRRRQSSSQETITQTMHSLAVNPLEESCLALLLQHPELKGSQLDLSPEYFENSENREIFVTWQQTNNLNSLKERLDTSIHEHLDSLVHQSLPPNQIELRYAEYIRRLRERFLKNLEAKRAEIFALEVEVKGTGADLVKLEVEGIEPSIQLKEVFTQKGRRRSELRR
jgi:DNA primase